MNYIFPYDLIEKGSAVALYGAGNVGMDFYQQIRKMNYCKIVAWTDKSFDSYTDVELPFYKTEELGKLVFDYIIIAILDKNIVNEVKEKLRILQISEQKIIWSDKYEVKTDLWIYNKSKLLNNFEFYQTLMDKYEEANSIYGGGQFYQSFNELGIRGVRDSQERLRIYQIEKFMNQNSTVLNIGCNCGFLDLQMAKFVKYITALEIEPLFVDIANMTRDQLHISNVDFKVSDFYKEDIKEQFDAVLCFAVHTNIMVSGATEEEFVDKVYHRTNQGGYLFFESHNLKNDRERFDRLCNMLINKNMKVCMHENYFSDLDRDVVILQKQ